MRSKGVVAYGVGCRDMILVAFPMLYASHWIVYGPLISCTPVTEVGRCSSALGPI